jgi:hypothetical protein
MNEIIITILASASVSTALAAVLVYLSKTVIGERIKSSIKHEYDQNLETHKVTLKAINDSEIEKLKATLKSNSEISLARLTAGLKNIAAERDARRDYEYEARKRLYEEYEPLLFQLVELSENAFYRVRSIARTARDEEIKENGEGWLEKPGYYMLSTIYKLLAPIALFKLMQRKLTFVDLTLDPAISNQYTLLKIIYLTFTCDFEFSRCGKQIEYNPNVNDWEVKRKLNPQKYWRQGLALGRLDNALEEMLTKEDGKIRLITFGEYENVINMKLANKATSSWNLTDIFSQFHPKSRPVMWRILIAQAHIYKIIAASTENDFSMSTVELHQKLIIPSNERKAFYWRAIDDKDRVKIPEFEEPFDIAIKFIGTYLNEFNKNRKHSNIV